MQQQDRIVDIMKPTAFFQRILFPQTRLKGLGFALYAVRDT